MRLTTPTPRQCTDVSMSLVPSLLRSIFTLSRFIGLETLICDLYLFWHAYPVPTDVVDPQGILVSAQRMGSSASTSPTRRYMRRAREQFGYERKELAKVRKAKGYSPGEEAPGSGVGFVFCA